MKKKVLVIGTGSQARYVIDIFHRHPQYSLMGLVEVENSSRIGTRINNIPIVSMVQSLSQKFSPKKFLVVVAYGNNSKKKELATFLEKKGYRFVNAISRLASVSPFARLGVGCILNPYSVVMPNAVIGDHVILHSHCVVEHDNQLGNYVNCAPGVSLAGRVQIGEGSILYTGARVIPDIKIGAWSMVAAGAVVIRAVADHGRVAGVPAQIMEKKS